MAETLGSRLKNAWNVFMNRDPTKEFQNGGEVSYYRPDRPRLTRGNERSIVTSVINRIAMDAAAINIRHAQLDGNQRYLRDVDSGLSRCLNLEANVDQTGRALRQDIYMSMMDEGCVAVVPVETNDDPDETDGYEILSLRTGKITAWMPQHVRIRLYDERTGKREEVTVPKKTVAIVENPLYAVMNEPNSTMQRLMRKLALLDVIDEQNSSGKLDLIIQLPYVIKTEARRQQAENRRKDIEQQLAGSKYGIAYTDGTEKITQLNRSLENNLMAQIEYLTSMLYSQLGITKEIMDGTATEEVMLNYNNRTIEPLVSAVADEMKRKFLTKTARTQGKSVVFFRDPFRLVPVGKLAETADKFTRNEIMTSNEFRQVIGLKPSSDPKADQLHNSNLNQAEPGIEGESQEDLQARLQELDEADADLNDMEADLAHSDEETEEEDELSHYASPYYDPVKAHECYMKTRELKGRKSTAGLNDEGKGAATYVKGQIQGERKIRTEVARTARRQNMERATEKARSAIASGAAATSRKVNDLRHKLSRMSKAEKLLNKGRIQSEIDTLREENARERQQIQTQLRNYGKVEDYKLRTESDRLKTWADETYNEQLGKIQGEKSFQNPKKRTRKKKS